MKKLLLILALLFIVQSVDAQIFNKKRNQIEVASDVKAIIVNGLIVDVYDFDGQMDKFESMKLQIKASGAQVPDPEFTILYDDELKLFRFAKTLQEITLQSDNLNIFKRKRSEIYDNRRTKYD